MITTASIREIQAGLSARNPRFGAPSADISAANGEPSSPADGMSVQTTTNESALYTALVVEASAGVTYSCVWWGYYSAIGVWATLDGGDRSSLGKSWSQIIPSGALDRVYCQITAVSGGVVRYHVGPCDPGAA